VSAYFLIFHSRDQVGGPAGKCVGRVEQEEGELIPAGESLGGGAHMPMPCQGSAGEGRACRVADQGSRAQAVTVPWARPWYIRRRTQ
jgi:hypothetical protein